MNICINYSPFLKTIKTIALFALCTSVSSQSIFAMGKNFRVQNRPDLMRNVYIGHSSQIHTCNLSQSDRSNFSNQNHEPLESDNESQFFPGNSSSRSSLNSDSNSQTSRSSQKSGSENYRSYGVFRGESLYRTTCDEGDLLYADELEFLNTMTDYLSLSSPSDYLVGLTNHVNISSPYLVKEVLDYLYLGHRTLTPIDSTKTQIIDSFPGAELHIIAMLGSELGGRLTRVSSHSVTSLMQSRADQACENGTADLLNSEIVFYLGDLIDEHFLFYMSAAPTQTVADKMELIDTDVKINHRYFRATINKGEMPHVIFTKIQCLTADPE